MLFPRNPSPRPSNFSFDFCYSHQDLHYPPVLSILRSIFLPTYTSPYSPCLPQRKRIGPQLSVIHFRGSRIRQVSHNTLLSGCRLSWPPSCCLYATTPFPPYVVIRHLNVPFGSFRIACSAYQKRPTRHSPFFIYFLKVNKFFMHVQSLIIGHSFLATLLYSFALPHTTVYVRYPEGNFG